MRAGSCGRRLFGGGRRHFECSAATGVLANDGDVDSPATSRRLFSVRAGRARHADPEADGSFIYIRQIWVPRCGQFTYVADNGAWSGNPGVPLSPPSSAATVTITVTNTDSGPTCTCTADGDRRRVGEHDTLCPAQLLGLERRCTHGDRGHSAACRPGNRRTSPARSAGRSATPRRPPRRSAEFTYTVTNNSGSATGRARITVTAAPPPQLYGFVNVQNLPPSGNKSFKTASTVPLRWQWTSNGVAVDTAGQAIVRAYVCAVTNNRR